MPCLPAASLRVQAGESRNQWSGMPAPGRRSLKKCCSFRSPAAPCSQARAAKVSHLHNSKRECFRQDPELPVPSPDERIGSAGSKTRWVGPHLENPHILARIRYEPAEERLLPAKSSG